MKYPGLSLKEIPKLREKYGLNIIPKKKTHPIIFLLFKQFTSSLIIILVIAAIIAFLMKERIDAIAIFAIVLLNAIIGFVQEYKAEKAIEALKKMVVPITTVIRNKEQIEIKAIEILPGDIVLLKEGDKIPADMELIESYSLKIDESLLSGESETVTKKINDTVYKGTIITSGRAIAKVKAIGKKTEFGKIINFLSTEKEQETPLTIQLNKLGKRLGILIIAIIIILLLLGIFREINFVNMLFIAVSLGVSAIPEGLPIIVTLSLALSVQTLAKKNAIVRKMSAIESLGATTVICSDKTGTLTLNEMTVEKIFTCDIELEVKGEGYSIGKKQKRPDELSKKILEVAENCNNSYLGKTFIGDPTEIALKVVSKKFKTNQEYEKIDEIAFSSERKMMSTLHKINQTKEIFAKGAFEEIIKRSKYILENNKIRKINKKDKIDFKKKNEEYAKKAYRVLAFAYKKYNKKYDENELIFLGIMGLKDPPRKTAKKSLLLAKKAGIQIKIITGDYPLTAKAIGEQLGLSVHNMLTGDEIDKLNDKELFEKIKHTEIFARTKPEHKYRIVDLLQKDGEIVAVTGDGVNDAPALKHADVGIAMGIKGSEATKEVADIVLKDDNFSTIINTIKEGRRIYKNILSFIKFLLSANFDSLSTVAVLTILNLPLPLLPLQILWINLATDGLPALALGTAKRENEDLMSEKPHPKKENILKKFLSFIIIAAILQTIINLIIYFYGRNLDIINQINTYDLSIPSFARTMVFMEIITFELFFVFVCKSDKKLSLKTFTSDKKIILAVLISLILNLGILYIPAMQSIFKTVSIGLTEWIIIIIGALSAFLVPITDKGIKNLYGKFIKK